MGNVFLGYWCCSCPIDHFLSSHCILPLLLPAFFCIPFVSLPPVPQGKAWALRQVNPSSDNHRFGGRHVPQTPQNSPGLAESCDHCSLSLDSGPEPENKHPADIPDTHISNRRWDRAHPPSSPPHPCQHPRPHLHCAFRGSDLVDWLVGRGLCAGRAEAQLYGVRLQQGGVLDPLTGQHRFRDADALQYHFSRDREGVRWA